MVKTVPCIPKEIHKETKDSRERIFCVVWFLLFGVPTLKWCFVPVLIVSQNFLSLQCFRDQRWMDGSGKHRSSLDLSERQRFFWSSNAPALMLMMMTTTVMTLVMTMLLSCDALELWWNPQRSHPDQASEMRHSWWWDETGKEESGKRTVWKETGWMNWEDDGRMNERKKWMNGWMNGWMYDLRQNDQTREWTNGREKWLIECEIDWFSDRWDYWANAAVNWKKEWTKKL